MTDRTFCIVLGRFLGTYDGWDEVESGCFQFDSFEPAPGVRLPKDGNQLQVDLNKGMLELWKIHAPLAPELLVRDDVMAVLGGVAIDPSEERGEIFYKNPLVSFLETCVHGGTNCAVCGNGKYVKKSFGFRIESWYKMYFNEREENFYIKGHVQVGGAVYAVETEEVIASHAFGTDLEIETKDHFYMLIGPAVK